MSVTVYGPSGSGTTIAYQAPKGYTLTVQTLAFTVLADGTGGVHRVRVRYIDDAGNRVVTLDDLNESGAGLTTHYSYGLGLNASACTTVDGLAVTDALPWTEIKDGAYVRITAIDDNGAQISGDAISAVVSQTSDPVAESGADNAPMPFLVPQTV